MGFRFHYHTHIQATIEGQQYIEGRQYLFCYEFGYLDIGNGWYLLVRENEDPSDY